MSPMRHSLSVNLVHSVMRCRLNGPPEVVTLCDPASDCRTGGGLCLDRWSAPVRTVGPRIDLPGAHPYRPDRVDRRSARSAAAGPTGRHRRDRADPAGGGGGAAAWRLGGAGSHQARAVHTDQRRVDVTTQVVPGGTVTERWVPVSRVGLYVPGGLAVYPSSVVMNVVPAQIAGVTGIAVASPPQRETGLPHPLVLAACALLGVDEVYAVGGAQAIAMFGYGVGDPEATGLAADAERCLPVNMVTGPGNIWVTAAKRLLRGLVGIDSEAGPTEIAILADDTADPVHVAADLISQAEHDPMAASVLVTPSEALAAKVEAELPQQVARTKHQERVTEALKGQQSAVVLVDDLDQGTAVVDAYAAEHLEIQTADAEERAALINNAGAIFIGGWSP